jgi:hypothetical protein
MYPREKDDAFEDDALEDAAYEDDAFEDISRDLLSEDEFPEEPNSWGMDDFDDLVDMIDEDFPE